jgi:comEA protein
MFNLTRQEQLIALILIAGIIIGGVVLWIRRDPAPPTPEPLEYEINLSEVNRENRNSGIEEDNGDGGVERSLIDLNTANEEELQIVPGIGPKTAETIIKYRETFGPFGDIDELIEVPGIGEKKLEKFKEHLTVAAEDGEE